MKKLGTLFKFAPIAICAAILFWNHSHPASVRRARHHAVPEVKVYAAKLPDASSREVSHEDKAGPAKAASFFKVSRVVDGDTLLLDNGEKVRLIGVDTPESRRNAKLARDVKKTRADTAKVLAMGKKASEFTRQLCRGKKVRLEYDVVPRDRYGRLLAYVYLEDGRFVNAEIMKAGYAQTMTIPPNVRYRDLFASLQREARNQGKGLWS